MIPVFIIQHLNANYTITAPTTQPKTNTPKSVLVAKSTLSMLKLNYSNYLYKETSMPGEILFWEDDHSNRVGRYPIPGTTPGTIPNYLFSC